MMQRDRSRWCYGLFLATLLCLPGCGRGIAEATGRVTHRGKPVVCGAVVFVGPDGMTRTGAITSDGTYRVAGVGAGRVGVAVVSEDPARPLNPYKTAAAPEQGPDPIDDASRAPDRGGAARPAGDRTNWAEPNVDRSKWFPLPKKYELVSTSGLSVELKAGKNTGIDIELP